MIFLLIFPLVFVGILLLVLWESICILIDGLRFW